MDDLEITKACAVAMRYEVVGFETKNGGIMVRSKTHHLIWNPLDDDEQAMALAKQFKPSMSWDGAIWSCAIFNDGIEVGTAEAPDLNRAISECVSSFFFSWLTVR